MLAAIPAACAMRSASSPPTIAAATAAPTAPQMDVACCPRSKNTELPSSRSYPPMPSRTAISIPTPAPSSSAVAGAPVASATASAAGTTGDDGCSTDGRWVSSKSRQCASVPLSSAAEGDGEAQPGADRGRVRRTTPAAHDRSDRVCGRLAGGGHAVADDVEHAPGDVRAQVRRQALLRDVVREPREALDDGVRGGPGGCCVGW